MRDDLPHAMRETARRLEPDVVRLAAGGVSRGTRLRRVERVVQVLGSAVAVAVVFAGVVLFGPFRATGPSGGGRDLNQSAVSGDGSSPMSSSPSPTGTPTTAGINLNDSTPTITTPSPTGTPQITQAELISALKSCLGGTGVTGRSFAARGSDNVPTDTVVPMSRITIAAQLSALNSVGSIVIVFSGPQDHVSEIGASQPLPDGSIVYVSQEPGSSDGRHADRIDLDVTLVRPGGSKLSVIETNSSTEKSAAVPGTPLLLKKDQVIAMLDSPVWDRAVAAAGALPASNGGTGAASWPSTTPSTH